MTKQPTKEGIIEIIENENRKYFQDPNGFQGYLPDNIYNALVQAGAIVDTKPSTVNDENKPTEPKTIWVCNLGHTTENKESCDRGMWSIDEGKYVLCRSSVSSFVLCSEFNSLQAQHTQALRRIEELQFKLNCLKHTIEEILFRTEEHSNEVNPKWIISECKQALTTDDEGEE